MSLTSLKSFEIFLSSFCFLCIWGVTSHQTEFKILTSPNCFFNSAFSFRRRDTFSASSLGALLRLSSTILWWSCAFSCHTLASFPASEILASCSFLFSSRFSAFSTNSGSASSEKNDPMSSDPRCKYGPENEDDRRLRLFRTHNSWVVWHVTARLLSCGLVSGLTGSWAKDFPSRPFSTGSAILTDRFGIAFSPCLSLIARISFLSVAISSWSFESALGSLTEWDESSES